MSNIENTNEPLINEQIDETKNLNTEVAAEPAEVEQSADLQKPTEAEPVAEAPVQPEAADPEVQAADAPVAEPSNTQNDEEKAKVAAENKRLAEEKQRQFDESFAKLKQANESGEAIEVVVNSRIKGGLRVMFDDIPIFLPTSHFGSRRNPTEEELTESIGKTLKVHIHELSEDEDNRKTVIVSRKKAIGSEVWSSIKVGDIVEGPVSSIASFGIFLDLGGIEGLIHISRLSQVHVEDTKAFAKLGDIMKAVVVEIDQERNRIALSRKEFEKSPWEGVEAKYTVGTNVKGTVRRFTDFGAYVEVDKGIDGLLRVAELSWTKRIKHPSEVLKIGEEIEVQVISISEEKNTMHLSYKRMQANPWEGIKDKFVIGNAFNGTVKQVMPQGCVVTIEGEVDGFMPRSKMRQLPRGKKIPYNIGDKIEILISDVIVEQESVIIEPKLDESEIAQAERSRDSERPQGKRREPKQPQVTTETPSGSFSLSDLLPDSMKETLIDQTK